jgi:hypothetical protein
MTDFMFDLDFIIQHLNPNVVTDGQGSFHFKCLFLCLLVLSIVSHTFGKLKISITSPHSEWIHVHVLKVLKQSTHFYAA